MVVHIMMNVFPFAFLSYWQVLYYVGCSRSIPPRLLLAASVIQHFLIIMCNTNQFFIGSFELSISISSCVGHWILCYWGANFSYEGRVLLSVCFCTLTFAYCFSITHTHTHSVTNTVTKGIFLLSVFHITQDGFHSNLHFIVCFWVHGLYSILHKECI